MKASGADDINNELMQVMKSYKISHLYNKFFKANVTPEQILDLDDEMLDEAELTKIEKGAYKKAVENQKKLNK